MGIASKGPRIVLRELSRGCTVSGRETVVTYDRDLIQTYPLLDIPRFASVKKTVFYLINCFLGLSSFQGPIESRFSGNFQALIPS